MLLPEPIKPWKPPEVGKIARGDAETLAGTIPSILFSWELTDSRLAQLFQVLCNSNTLAPSRAYGTISNIPGRKKALLAAASVFFHSDEQDTQDQNQNKIKDQKYLKELTKKYNELGGVRNNIAHSMLINFDGKVNDLVGAFLIPPFYSTSKMPTGNLKDISYFYDAVAVWDIACYFREFDNHVFTYVLYISRTYGIPVTSGGPLV